MSLKLVYKFALYFFTFIVFFVGVFFNNNGYVSLDGEKALALNTVNGDGLLLYAQISNTNPQWRTYSESNNDFSSNSNTVSASVVPSIVQLRTSPTKQEAIGAYQDTVGNLHVLCYNGSSWTEDWTVAVAGTGTPTTRRFDIVFETSTGDVTVAYSRNTAATNALAFRTKAGSVGCGSGNWSSASNFSTGTSATTGTVQWVKAARDGRSGQNLSAWIWADSNADLGGAIWDGSTFTNFKSLETSLEVVTAAQDVDDFEVQYESLSGNVMVTWASSVGTNGTMGAYYNRCTGGTSSCTWGSTATKIWTTAGDDATTMDLSANPLSNEMIWASIGNAGSDLQIGYWSGSAWTARANLDTTCETPVAGRKLVTTGWLTNNGNTKWYVSYDDSTGTGISWYYGIGSGTPTRPTDFTSSPTINDIRLRYDTDFNPFNNAEVIQTISHNGTGLPLLAFKLAMNTSGNLSWSNMTTAQSWGSLPTAPQEGYKFQYWRHIPVVSVTASDGVVQYGSLSPNVSKATIASELNDTQTATNNGEINSTFNIKGQDASGGGCTWTLAGTNGADQYIHHFCNASAGSCDAPPTNYTALTTNYQTLSSSVNTSASVNFDLRLTTPTSSTCFGQQSADVTVQAVAN